MNNDMAETIKTPCLKNWPESARSTDALAYHLSGRDPAPASHLWDVFPPEADLASLTTVTPRGDTRQILAQFECFLADGRAAVARPGAEFRLASKLKT
jgi:hypothetical protein